MINIDTTVPLTKAQQKASYRYLGFGPNNKHTFIIPCGNVIKLKSAFETKKLCDGPTFSLGMACHARCSFCYVPSQLSRHAAIGKIIAQTGLDFSQLSIAKEDPLPVLLRQLRNRKGEKKYADPNDHRTVFSSPLVDVAANKQTAEETIEACKIILKNTNWHIRLLSKFALLEAIADKLKMHRERMIYGFSTGTLDDRVAWALERGTSSPTARLKALYRLQDDGYRTFAMICPILPQADYGKFATLATDVVRHKNCEHVWAEIFNLRGKSLKNSCDALAAGGFTAEALRLQSVSGKSHKAEWETYARKAFLALSKIVPPDKLRFLQYVQKDQTEWWQRQRRRGAVLLGKHAEGLSNKQKGSAKKQAEFRSPNL